MSNDNSKFFGNERWTLTGKIKVKEANANWLYIGFQTQPLYSAIGAGGDAYQSAKVTNLYAAASIRSLGSNLDFG